MYLTSILEKGEDMLTFHVVVDVDHGKIVYEGGLDECSQQASKLARDNPGIEYIYAKVVPVGVHKIIPNQIRCANHSATILPMFPERPSLAM